MTDDTEATDDEEQTTESTDQQMVKYEVTDDTLNPEARDDHERVGDGVFVAPESSELDGWESMGFIDVLEWDYQPVDDTEMTGPPEILITDDEELVYLAKPSDRLGEDLQTIPVGKFECQRCGTHVGDHLSRGDSIQEPHECPGCERQGPFLPAGIADADLDWTLENMVNPMWQYPPTDIRDGVSMSTLWDEARDYIETYWDTRDDFMYPGLTAFALSSWLRPNYDFVPHLLVMGKHESGKTRLLHTLERLSYRAIVPVSTSAAGVYRTIDRYDVSFYLSEYHDLDPDIQREIDACIKGAQKRDEIVIRNEPGSGGEGYDPRAFDQFTHVAVGTQFEPQDDIVSRCIPVNTHPGSAPMTLGDASGIRNGMLYKRFELLDSNRWDKAEQDAIDYLDQRDITGRLREKLLCLVTVAQLADRVDELDAFVNAMQGEHADARANSEDAMAVQAIMECAFDDLDTGQEALNGTADPWDTVAPLQKDIVDTFNEMTGRDISSRKFTHIRKRLGIETSRKRDGVVLDDPDLRDKLERLADENNIDWERADIVEPVREIRDPDKGECALCGEWKDMEFRNVLEGHTMCYQCGDEERASYKGDDNMDVDVVKHTDERQDDE